MSIFFSKRNKTSFLPPALYSKRILSDIPIISLGNICVTSPLVVVILEKNIILGNIIANYTTCNSLSK